MSSCKLNQITESKIWRIIIKHEIERDQGMKKTKTKKLGHKKVLTSNYHIVTIAAKIVVLLDVWGANGLVICPKNLCCSTNHINTRTIRVHIKFTGSLDH